MAKKAQRAFALIAAILFLLTSVGFTGFTIWQMNQENKAVDNNQSLSKQQNGSSSAVKKLDNYQPVSNVTELQKTDLVVGNGDEVKPGATITAHYTGALASDGTIFESSLDKGKPFTSPLQIPSEENGGRGLIAGWVEGIVGMRPGGKRRLVIPADKAYGSQSPSEAIPPNSALVFDIELISIQ